MDEISLKTYAKINLSLDVTGLRPDGYHEVAMVMQAVELSDVVTVGVRKAHRMGVGKIHLTCDRTDVPCDEKNTAWKAAALMMQRSCTPVDIYIDIKKGIPAAAGLAGGSSDAAGVLLALNELLEQGMDLYALCALGKKIGADVPFSIMALAAAPEGAPCALACGIGELLTPAPALDAWVLLAKPPLGVSTPAVYKALDAVSGYAHPDTEQVLAGVRTGSLAAIAAATANVLETVTLRDYPEVAALRTLMHELASSHGAALTMMSGSGPTVYSLFAPTDKTAAESAYADLRRRLADLGHGDYTVELVRTVK